MKPLSDNLFDIALYEQSRIFDHPRSDHNKIIIIITTPQVAEIAKLPPAAPRVES